MSEEFDKYTLERLRVINAKRALEGHDPIDQDTFNNVTFGYEDDERRVARDLFYKNGGYGSGSGGSGGRGLSLQGAQVGRVDVRGNFKYKKPTVSVKKTPIGKAAKAKGPKVSIKKSKV